MDLTEKISALQSSAQRQLPALTSLKKTKTALILPFFDALGYDPFDVREIEPDFEMEVEEQGMRTVDYTVKRGSAPLMLVQCEEAKTDLGDHDDSFLLESLDELEADIAVFTNGLHYQFYVDLEAEVNAHRRPFLELDLLDYGPEEVEGLKRLTRSDFDVEAIRSAAYDRTCSRLLRSYFAQQQQAPDEHLVRFMAAQVYDGEVGADVVERFRPVVRNVLQEVVGGEGGIQEAGPSTTEASMSSDPQQDRPQSPDQEQEQEDMELTASDEDALANGEEEQDGDPFDKDLARRVIDDF